MLLSVLVSFSLCMARGDSPDKSPLITYLEANSGHPTLLHQEKKYGGQILTFSTGTWHGSTWINQVFLYDASPNSYRPGGLSDAAILHITGDDPDITDINEAKRLSILSGLPVAIVFNEPNQPLFGKSEDDLMAFSFSKQIQTGDWSWPVLFPMVRSAFKAMDGIQSITHNRLHRFVVYGNSKRGWTTWLAAEAGDPRIIGIAPGSIDILNMPAQLKAQLSIWGHPSPMYQAYEESGLLGQANSQPVLSLMAGIDPYTNLNRISVPILSVRGSSDPFWLPDAVHYFKGRLPEQTWLLNLPNEPHDYKVRAPYLSDLAAFSRMAAARDSWPHIHTKEVDGKLKIWCSQTPISIKLYSASSSSGTFPAGAWNLSGLVAPRPGVQTSWLPMPKLGSVWGAWYVSASFQQNVGFRPQIFTTSSPIVLRKLDITAK